MTILDTRRQSLTEAEQRELAPEDQAFYVAYMGALGYTLLAMFDTEAEAEAALPDIAKANIAAAPKPMFAHWDVRRITDYQVRQQHSLDGLAQVLRDGRNEATAAYNEARGL